MATYQTLYESTKKVSPKTLDSVGSPVVHDLDLNYNEKSKTITYTARIKSKSRPEMYNLIVEFKDVESQQGLTEEEIEQGFQPKPSLSDNDIRVFCNCPSYRFRFDEANRSWKSGTGPKFPAYSRKTNRAPNNPDNLPGFCYHIIELVNYLKKQGFILD